MALAPTISPSAKADFARPVAVELFTPQGCYSCPPTEAYLIKLAKLLDVMALEWNANYWGDLVYGGAGKWKNPFSSTEAMTRRRDYDQSIRGQGWVDTSQIIVAGVSVAVGSNRADGEHAIRQMRKAAPR